MADRVDYLTEPDGTELHWDGLRVQNRQESPRASLTGPVPTYKVQTVHPADREGMQRTSASQASTTMPMETPRTPSAMGAAYAATPLRATPVNLSDEADKMLAEIAARHSLLEQKAAVGDRDDAGNVLPSWLKQTVDDDS